MQAHQGKLAGGHAIALPVASLWAAVNPVTASDYKFTVDVTDADIEAGNGEAVLGPMPVGAGWPDFNQFLMVQETQKDNDGIEWGFCGADGNLDAGYPHAEKMTKQGQQAKLYRNDATPGQNRADLKHAGNFVAKFKKPGSYTFSVGRG